MVGTRNLIVRSLALRHAIKNTVRPLLTNTNLHSRISKSSLFAATLASSSYSSHLSLHHSRSLSSASGFFNFYIFQPHAALHSANLVNPFSASPGVILVNSAEEFNKILSKIQGLFLAVYSLILPHSFVCVFIIFF